MDWPVVDLDARRCSIRPGQRVLHPCDVESLGKILAEVGAAALLPIECARHRNNCLQQQIVELEGLDESGAEDSRLVPKPALSECNRVREPKMNFLRHLIIGRRDKRDRPEQPKGRHT
jgi:hypothetical protein